MVFSNGCKNFENVNDLILNVCIQLLSNNAKSLWQLYPENFSNLYSTTHL